MATMHAPRQAERPRGLRTADAERRLASDGPNEVPAPAPESLVRRLARQLREPMALLLVATALVELFALRKRVEAIAILSIVCINAAIALAQEGRATRALEALKELETPTSRVVRDGIVVQIPSRDIVRDDVVLVAAGDRVPADMRLVEARDLEIDESPITGESLPVPKAFDETLLAGTLVTRGTGAGVVAATGAESRLGRLARTLEEPQPATPVQIELRKLSARLGSVAVVLASVVFALTLVRASVHGSRIENAFLAAVALAVAAVPEGLPTVVTVSLAFGVHRMAREGAIIRRLPAVETLGAATVLLTDKTGTLTENRMRLDAVVLPGRLPAEPGDIPSDQRALVDETIVLCNDAEIEPPSGDPMEIALLESAGPASVRRIRGSATRVSTAPFESATKRMTTVHRAPIGYIVSMKGAPEVVLDRCIDLSPAEKTELHDHAGRLAERGARVLACARAVHASMPPSDGIEYGLDFVCLVAFADPLKAEAPGAVAAAKAAGLRIVMVTGDHAGTAAAIARAAGLSEPGARVVTGAELRRDGIPPDPSAITVYARVEPEDKLALTSALRNVGDVVAVTGDGVNDAPAMRRANIGVAMGSGSDVAREAGDMIITDDNLSTIVNAVREGRAIYDNIRKVVEYLVAGNLSEILVVVGALLFFPHLGVPLTPLQLLWLNLLTDGLPAAALSIDPAHPGLIQARPRPRSERLLGIRDIRRLGARAIVIASFALGAFAIARLALHQPLAHARTTMFSTLIVSHLLYAFIVRRPRTGGRPGPTNRWLIGAVCLGIGLQLAAITIPAVRPFAGMYSLDAKEWMLVAGLGMSAPALIALASRRRRR